MLLLFTSCVKEDMDECRYPSEIRVSLWDKEYDNKASFDREILESLYLPAATISSLYYTLIDSETGREALPPGAVNGLDLPGRLPLDLSALGVGSYVLTVWGDPDEDGQTGQLHRDNGEQTDLFVASATFTVGEHAPETVWLNLRRAKGHVFVIVHNLPPHINRISKTVTGVAHTVSGKLTYSGTTTLLKEFSGFSSDTALLQTTVAPTVEGGVSQLSLGFHSDTRVPVNHFDLEVRLERNRLTGVLLDYDNGLHILTAWVFIDGRWSVVKHLEVNLTSV